MIQPRVRLHLCLAGLLGIAMSIAPAGAQQRGGRGGPAAPPPGAPTFRFMGPAVGNRIAAAVGVPGDLTTYYAGAASGGVWKSTNSGQSWAPVFRQPTGAGDRRAGSFALQPQHCLGGHRRGLGHPR